MKRVKRVGLVVLVVAATMISTTASADEGFVELQGMSMIAGETERALGQDTTVDGTGLVAGFEPEGLDGMRWMVGLHGDGFTNGRFDGDVQSGWSRNRVMGMADWGVDLLDGLVRPLIRGGLGYSRQSLELTADDVTYRGTDHGLSGLVAGGLEVSLGRGEVTDQLWTRFSLGFNALFGYLYQTEASFEDMETTREFDDDQWERAVYDAGSMRVSGLTWSGGVLLRYQFGE